MPHPRLATCFLLLLLPAGHLRAQTEASYLRWRLLPQEQTYTAIDGPHLKQYVNDITAISRRYRDQGHQFWGRIIGTEADAENAQWMLEKFRQIGLSDVRSQAFDLAPQWMPQSWVVAVSGYGKTLQLDSAQPAYQTEATPAGGLDLEAVYVGLGSEADLAGRDVRGKAAFIYSIPLPGSWRHSATVEGALQRVEARGASAIFVMVAIPGNIRTQFYPTRGKVPTFSIGMKDGIALRDLIGQAPSGQPPRARVRLDVKMVPNLKTATVWGMLPGTTDETIFVVAHRDGWFEGANDNASGMATMLGLAEYFAKVPPERRRRNIQFLGTSGHHNGAAVSGTWLAEHKEIFAKTALIINCEHTGAVQTYLYAGGGPARIEEANAAAAFDWYIGGSRRLEEIVVKAYDAFGVARYTEPARTPAGEIGRIHQFAPSIQVIDAGPFFHSDHETPDTVTPTGLEAVTRAYAKIITDINAVDLKDLGRR